jgi:hypothetical protein
MLAIPRVSVVRQRGMRTQKSDFGFLTLNVELISPTITPSVLQSTLTPCFPIVAEGFVYELYVCFVHEDAVPIEFSRDVLYGNGLRTSLCVSRLG